MDKFQKSSDSVVLKFSIITSDVCLNFQAAFRFIHNEIEFMLPMYFTPLWSSSQEFPGYRSRDPGSIPGATRFSEKYWVWNGAHSAS
jgi:hypothetical protein